MRFRREDLPVTNAPLIMTTVPRRDFLVSMHSPSAASDQPWTATAALALSGCVYVMPLLQSDDKRHEFVPLLWCNFVDVALGALSRFERGVRVSRLFENFCRCFVVLVARLKLDERFDRSVCFAFEKSDAEVSVLRVRAQGVDDCFPEVGCVCGA